MSTSVINTFFNQNPKYLNDIYGIDYVAKHEHMYGWRDFTGLFCDSMMLWCAYDAIENNNLKKIKDFFYTTINGALDFYYESHQFNVKYARKGSWNSYDKASAELEAQNPWISGFLGYNVTFHNIEFKDFYYSLEKALKLLRNNNILLNAIDVTVDCGYISTRKIIEEYILSHKLIDKDSIVNDRRSVGDNCISFYQNAWFLNNTKTRVKIYNKFIQVLESCEIGKQLGSSLSNFVAGEDVVFTEKLKRFYKLGYTRIEISVYGSTIFASELYKEAMYHLINVDLAGCPTFKVPLQEQWNLIVDRLTQVVAVYVENKRVFAYCHWWNSLTKRKQGIYKSDVNADLIECLLSNYSFNDRIIHCFHLQVKDGIYNIVKHDRYKRINGSTAMTLVPGVHKTLFPSRDRLEVEQVMFKNVGLGIHKNVYIEWPMSRIEQGRKSTLVDLVKVSDGFDMSTVREALPLGQTLLAKIEKPQSSKYRSDYACLEINNVYTVMQYGYGLFRGKEYLHLILEEKLMVRCSIEMRSCLESKILEGACFKFKVLKISKVKGTMRTQCQIA